MPSLIPNPKAASGPHSHPPGIVKRTQQGNWRPWCIRTPFLIFFVLLCVSLCMAIEFLLRWSERKGGLVFADDGDFSRGTNFIFNYLPTVISVVFGLLWAIVEHDIKRLEPFFRLSEAQGANAQNSLCLDYPYSNPIILPLVAFKRRHWSVFCASTITLISVFFLIPIMSGIFEERDDVIRSITTTTTAPSFPPTLNTSTDFLTSTYLAYRYAWSNSALPNLTTPAYTLHPITIPSARPTENFTAETTLYEADLACKPAVSTKQDYGFKLSDGASCSWKFLDEVLASLTTEFGIGGYIDHMLSFKFTAPWSSLFMGHANGTGIGSRISERYRINEDLYTLSSSLADCPEQRRFLAMWGSKMAWEGEMMYIPEKWTALFCEPSYWAQRVVATVRVDDGRQEVLNVTRMGERVPFEGFNSVGFEGLAATGFTEAAAEDKNSLGYTVGFGYEPAEWPNSEYVFRRNFGQEQVKMLNPKSIAGFMMSKQTNDSLAGLLDAEKLGRAYSEAYQLLFAFGIARGLVSGEAENGATTVPVVRSFEVQAFVANNLWCRLTQAGFSAVALLALCIVILSWGRKCNLDGEPNSLLESMLAIAESHGLCRDMHNSEYRAPAKVAKALVRSAHQYRLWLVDGEGPIIESVNGTVADPSTVLVEQEFEETDLKPYKSKAAPERTLIVGVGFFVFFGGLLAFLTFLYLYAKNHQGLPTVALTNSFWYKVLFTFIPTVLGMAVEPLWVVLGSYACMIGPYEALNRPPAQTSKAMILDYDRTPPHFQLWQAIRSGNYLLTALTIAILSANFLAVAFGGLFSPTTHAFTSISMINWFPTPVVVEGFVMNRAPYSTEELVHQEMYYLLAGNLTGDRMSDWTTPEMYFAPFGGVNPGSEAVSWQSNTWGFGADVTCDLVPESSMRMNTSGDAGDLVREHQLHLDYPCWGGVMDLTNAFGDPGEGFESIYRWLESPNPSTDYIVPSVLCPGAFFTIWGELPGDPQPKNQTWPYLDFPEYVVLACNSSLEIKDVVLSVDDSNNTVSYSTSNSLPNTEINRFLRWNTSSPMDDFIFSFLSTLGWERTFKVPLPAELTELGILNGKVDPSWNPHSIMWIDNLMFRKEPGVRRHGTNVSHLPDTKHVAEALQYTFRSLFSIYLELHSDEYFAFGEAETIQGGINYLEDRVEISTAMYATAVGILGFFLLVVVFVYWVRPGGGLNHLPTTLAAVYTLLYASNAREDYRKLRGRSTKERAEKLVGLGNTYRYGSFVGLDRRPHFGVYKETTGPGRGEMEGLIQGQMNEKMEFSTTVKEDYTRYD